MTTLWRWLACLLAVSTARGSIATMQKHSPLKNSISQTRPLSPHRFLSSHSGNGARQIDAGSTRVVESRRDLGKILSIRPNMVVKSEAVAMGTGEQMGDNGRSVEDTSTGKGFFRSVYKFTRPHTIRGTILGSFAGVARVLIESPTAINLDLIPRATLGLMTLLFGNVYIVGINQIFDEKIDRVNKPFLPIAAGELSRRVAWLLVAATGIAGLALCYLKFSPLIFGLYAFGLFIGTIYSIPPFYLKKNPIAAGTIIATVRGFLLNFGVYYAAREALGLSFEWSPAAAFIARFMTVFALVIAVTKDLPDVQGDKKYGVKTFATRLGTGKVAALASLALGANYIHAIATAFVVPAGAFHTGIMVGGHALFALMLARTYSLLNPQSQESIKKFYARIWDLFYLEYALYPFL